MERRAQEPTPERRTSCTHCGSEDFAKAGRDNDGAQRYRCKGECGRIFSDPRPPRPLGKMRLPVDRAALVLSLLCEGMSIRATERVLGHHRDTICRLIVLMGERCERISSEMIRDLPVEDVQCDEQWGFLQCKERFKRLRGIRDSERGDCWTFLALDRKSKLVLASQIGRRTYGNTVDFVEKLAAATSGELQVSVDGFDCYPDAFETDWSIGERVHLAQLIKVFQAPPEEDQRRYSPASIIAIEKIHVLGNPDPDRVCTSHVERLNLSNRMHMRRMTRLTNGFSKKLRNHRAMWNIWLAFYNLCRIHTTIRCTPAMAAGVTATVWSLHDLIGG